MDEDAYWIDKCETLVIEAAELRAELNSVTAERNRAQQDCEQMGKRIRHLEAVIGELTHREGDIVRFASYPIRNLLEVLPTLRQIHGMTD